MGRVIKPSEIILILKRAIESGKRVELVKFGSELSSTDNPCVLITCVEYTEGRGKNKSVHLSIDVFMNVTVMLASNDSPSTCMIILYFIVAYRL